MQNKKINTLRKIKKNPNPSKNKKPKNLQSPHLKIKQIKKIGKTKKK